MGDPVEPTCILVVGMHRSGTSAVTRTLGVMGATLPGNLVQAMEDNARGFWESADVVALHNRFLAAVGSGWHDPRGLPPQVFESDAAIALRADLLAMLRTEFHDAKLFLIKDPRLCVLMPIWRPLLETFGARPVVAFPFRHPEEVALSLVRRNGISREHALALWLSYNLSGERDTRGLRRVFFSYDAFLADPATVAQTVAKGLGCYDAASVAAQAHAVEDLWRADMRHHAVSEVAHERESDPSPWVETAYQWLLDAAADQQPSEAPLDAIGATLDEVRRLYGPLIGAGLPPYRRNPPLSVRIKRRLAKIG